MTQEEKIKVELLGDEMLFCQYILPHHFYLESPPMHIEIADLLQSGYPHNAVAAPRKHAKTTLVSLGHALYCIVFGLKHFIVIVSETDTIAQQLVDDIRNELDTNERILRLWGHLEGAHWGEKGLETITQIMVLPRGTGQQVRGLKYRQYRPDLIILDDIESEENTATRDQRKKISKWFYGEVLFATGEEDQKGNQSQVVIAGTILHYDSLLARITNAAERFQEDEQTTLRKEEEKKKAEELKSIVGETENEYDFHTLFYSVETAGTPAWKERYPIEKIRALERYYKKVGELSTFYLEWYNDPTRAGNRPFQKKQFLYFAHKGDYFYAVDRDNRLHLVRYEDTNRFILVDPAISEKDDACDTAIVCVALDFHGNIYVLEYVADKLTPGAQISETFRMQRKYQAKKVGIESVAYQKSLKFFCEEKMRDEQYFFAIEPLNPDADKVRRIMRLQPRYEAGTIYHQLGMYELEEQLVLMPKPPLLDILDALAYAPELAWRPAPPKEPVPSVGIGTDETKYIDWLFKRNLERVNNPARDWSAN